ncbi:hypothetical protein CJU35_04370 [Pseudomonas aeruginosa]|nr:hypothetical protein CJU35_04370 [Pseudomonas aeruginosa]
MRFSCASSPQIEQRIGYQRQAAPKNRQLRFQLTNLSWYGDDRLSMQSLRALNCIRNMCLHYFITFYDFMY